MNTNIFRKTATILLACAFIFFSVQLNGLPANAAEPVIDGAASTVTSGMFASDSLDNTWLFGGGVETQGRFAEIGGVRNYIGQFEEYVRWEKRVNSVLEGMQRYTINAGKAGQDASAFAGRLADSIAKIQPKAVSYLIGPEDYSQGEDGIWAFENAVSEIIETSLDMKDGTGYVVIQLPHAVNDVWANANAALYAESAQAVAADVATQREPDAGRIAIVDHFSQTDNDTFKHAQLTDGDLLNADGHYQLARQFSREIYGSDDNFPEISGNWQSKDVPQVYPDAAPAVTAYQDGLYVTVPKNIAENSWNYILEIDGVTISGTASGNPFTIAGLPAGKKYLLTVRTADGKTQLSQVTGSIVNGDLAKEPQTAEGIPQEIRTLAENKDTPLTWLFMGDSITHAAAHTHGYDGIAQLFEKYLKEDLGRTDDFVVNTAVSGATTQRTIENIEQRMKKYLPDIVSVMLGTNDTINEDYKTNLKRIVAAIREVNPDAKIIFRSPTPAARGDYAAKLVGENGSVAYMKSVAEEDGRILFIDQYTEWQKEFTAYPYLFNAEYYLGDGFIHPGAAGQVYMFQQFIRECGLTTGARTANLSYLFSYDREQNNAVPDAIVSQNSVTLRRQDLQEAYGNGEIGDLELTLTDSDGRTYTKSITPDNPTAVITNLPTSRRYVLSATATLKGSAQKLVTFASKEIILSTGTESDDLKTALTKYKAIRQGDLTVYTEDSAADFQIAFDAAQSAIDSGTTDVELLAKLCANLENAAAKLTKKTVTPPPVQTLPDGSQEPAPIPPTPQPIQKGQVYENGNYRYKILNTSQQTVQVIGAKDKKLKKIIIPDHIQIGGNTYRVTSVAPGAFKNYKNAQSAVIGKQVETIEKQAFSGCDKLKSISINSVKLKSIGEKAFFNCKKLNKITIKSRVLKSVGKNSLKGIHKKAVLKVPSSKFSAYQKLFKKKGQGKQVKITK